MRIVAITGTNIKGCTSALMTLFLDALGTGHTVESFTLPKEGPPYCTGCKTCFLRGEDQCPHADTVTPLWNAMLGADLLVLAYPMYALRAPAQVKSLLDHLCVHWIVHRPDPVMFSKRAVVLTQGIGAICGAALKDAATSLSWLGVSDIGRLGVGMMEDVFWDKLSEKRRAILARKVGRLAARYRTKKNVRMSPVVRMKFALLKLMHRKAAHSDKPLSLDDSYWKERFFTPRG